LKKQVIDILKNFITYLLLCLGTFLMLQSISRHFTFDPHVGFLKVKQDYLQIPIWKAVFYIHVFSAILTLLAGFTQFSTFILTRHRKIHKILGRLYAWNIFLVNFPSGFIMAIYANGGFPSKIAFLILDCLWFAFTLKAVVEIKRGNIQSHKNYMLRSYALTCSALTLRTWKLILSNLLVIDPATLYMIDAWLGFVPNLLFAEWLIRRKNNASLTSEVILK
jgi:uncharacterized membrane protein